MRRCATQLITSFSAELRTVTRERTPTGESREPHAVPRPGSAEAATAVVTARAESATAAGAGVILSAPQLSALAQLGEERTAEVGEVLSRVGDRSYPFIAILEGEVAIVDPSGNEIARQGPSHFLGELNLLSGQTVFLTAVATQPLRYIAVEREVMRSLLFEDGPLSDLVLSAFIARREALQRLPGVGLEIIGPHSSAATMRMVEFARNNRLPYNWRDSDAVDDSSAAVVTGLDAAQLPVVRLPGGLALQAPSPGEVSRALG